MAQTSEYTQKAMAPSSLGESVKLCFEALIGHLTTLVRQ